MNAKTYVACDLGAESGRVIYGSLAKGTLDLEESYRFTTGPSTVCGSLRWNILRFFDEIKRGLSAVYTAHGQIDGLSVDAWANDYAYFSKSDPLLALPFHYRDPRTDEAFPAFLSRAGRDLIFRETGIQFLPIQTLYQLFDDVIHRPKLQSVADVFLCIADYFHFLLCGEVAAEKSSASTTQIFNPVTNRWSEALISKLGCPSRLFPQVVSSGTSLGQLDTRITDELGINRCEVFATCSHDTGAAVAAAPASGSRWAFLSSGTWSLLGVELDQPLINEKSLFANYTNELGFENRVRFLKNITGLWIFQEVRRELLQLGTEFDYARLTAEAAAATPRRSLIFPNDPQFLKPGGMIEKVKNFCGRTGQPVPETVGSLARCILESLALSYAVQISELKDRFGCAIDVLHIVGGGSKNRLLNQFTANATGTLVTAGPTEATAIGNILIQAVASGELASGFDIREVVRRSFPIECFEPRDGSPWQEALWIYQKLIEQ